MIVKLFEVRDRATFLPVLAVLLRSEPNDGTDGEKYLLMRCGYPNGGETIMLTRLAGDGRACCDPQSWGDRTMQVIHFYLEQHFDDHSSGDVLDVEYILEEKPTRKRSERFE